MTDLFAADIERQPLQEYIEKAYLNYSMYVILDRALPHIGDGMKPVQRRIVYAMSELGLKAGAKFKKSARTVGDVLGKYHPHSDTACYEAMVLMAQSFAYRYPLVDGQGNWGSADDPKSFAAMRYTEARLTGFAQLLLAELGQGTVDWAANFDGTLNEPRVLPAQVPNLLLNGTTGIAVGMATDIPPHNFTEVVQACIYAIDHPQADTSDLMEFIKGPDFPTQAELISSPLELKKIYETGRGSLRMRALSLIENGDIVITALPYQVSGAKILEQIAAQMQKKKLPMVADLRDESDHENPTRLVIVPRSAKVDTNQLMSHLFASTDLERSYRVNMNVVGLDGRPKVKPLTEIITEWLCFRSQVVRRRLEHRLEKVLSRLHLLEGLMIAFLNLDEVIEIIRTQDKPKIELIHRFGLSEQQAEAILELKLRHLAKLEEMKIRHEQDALEVEKEALEKTLGSERGIKNLLKKEMRALLKIHQCPRLSPIVVRQEAQAFSENDLIKTESVTVVLSEQNWIRSAKGQEIDPRSLNYKAGDQYWMHATGRTNEATLLVDERGRSYSLATHTLASARGHGEPVSGRLNLAPKTQFVGLLLSQEDKQVLLASSAGYGFVAELKDLMSKNKAGKALVTVPDQAKALKPLVFAKEAANLQVAVVTNEGRLLIFPLLSLPIMARGKGNKMIHMPVSGGQAEKVVDLAIFAPGQSLRLYSGRRHINLKPNDWAYYQSERGRRGKKLPRGFQKVASIEVPESQ